MSKNLNEDLKKTLFANKGATVDDNEPEASPIRDAAPKAPKPKRADKSIDALAAQMTEDRRPRKVAITFHVAEDIDEKLRYLVSKVGLSRSKVLEKLIQKALEE